MATKPARKGGPQGSAKTNEAASVAPSMPELTDGSDYGGGAANVWNDTESEAESEHTDMDKDQDGGIC